MAAFSLRWISTLPFLFFVCLIQLSERGSQTGEFAVSRLKKREKSSHFFYFLGWDFGCLTNRCCLSFARSAGKQLVDCRGFTGWKITSHLFIVVIITSVRWTKIVKTPKKLVCFSVIVYFFPHLLFPPPAVSLPFSFFFFLLSHCFPPSPRAPFRAGFVTVVACLSRVFWWATVDMTAYTFCQAP